MVSMCVFHVCVCVCMCVCVCVCVVCVWCVCVQNGILMCSRSAVRMYFDLNSPICTIKYARMYLCMCACFCMYVLVWLMFL